VGAIAAYNKYGDRTEVTEKSLQGTKEAMETLLAYLGRSLAEAVAPTIETILSNATTSPDGTIKEIRASTILKELNGETFQDDVSSFVNADVEELLFYRALVHARVRWSTWAKRMSRGVFVLLIVQGLFTFFFFVESIIRHSVSSVLLLVTCAISAVVVGFCVVCAGAMLHHHEQISDYRDKIL